MGRIFEVRPTDWEIDHIVAYNYLLKHDTLPNMPFWRDISFRYHRSPESFAINHPNFKLQLDRIFETVPSVPSVPSMPITVSESTTPEPASVILMALAIIMVGVWHIKSKCCNYVQHTG